MAKYEAGQELDLLEGRGGYLGIEKFGTYVGPCIEFPGLHEVDCITTEGGFERLAFFEYEFEAVHA